MQPRNVTRWKDGTPTRTAAVPAPFGPVRAEEINRQAQARAQLARLSFAWREFREHVMSDGELAYVLAILDGMPGWACWETAFNRVRDGRAELAPQETARR